MRILLTNDDGIDAEGLAASAQTVIDAVAEGVLPENTTIAVVAPDRGRSECGHAVTSTRPLTRIARKPSPLIHDPVGIPADWSSVDGTPVDCLRVALSTAPPKRPFDLVISGVNQGANLGTNLHVSGTFAAAREAAISGVPSLAVSHYRNAKIPRTWDHVSDWTRPVLAQFMLQFSRLCDATAQDSSRRVAMLWNVNLPAVPPQQRTPSTEKQAARGDAANSARRDETHRNRYHVPELAYCPVDTLPIPRVAREDGQTVTFEIDFHRRPRTPGHDIDRCFAGAVTVSSVDPHLKNAMFG